MVQWKCHKCYTYNNFKSAGCKKCKNVFEKNPKYIQEFDLTPFSAILETIGNNQESVPYYQPASVIQSTKSNGSSSINTSIQGAMSSEYDGDKETEKQVPSKIDLRIEAGVPGRKDIDITINLDPSSSVRDIRAAIADSISMSAGNMVLRRDWGFVRGNPVFRIADGDSTTYADPDGKRYRSNLVTGRKIDDLRNEDPFQIARRCRNHLIVHQFEDEEPSIDMLNTEIDNYEAINLINEINKRYIVTGKPFRDTKFPSNNLSLYFPTTKRAESIQWLRPTQFRLPEGDTRPWTVCNNPTASDIEQGSLGNCWFLSALAVVAERPQLIQQIVLTKEYQACGAYQIRLCHGGQWKTVTVDDSFPCDQSCTLVYSQAKNKQLWVPLIEKAAAKLHGCYEALIAGYCIESLNMLTGAPCETYVIAESDIDDLWTRLYSCHTEKYLFGASSGGGSGQGASLSEFERNGLRPKHAYSILDIKNVDGKHRLIKLKNPWGNVVWNGDWSESSPLWNQIKEDLRYEMKKDIGRKGMFWMCLRDIKRFFTSIDVCRLLTNDWSDVRLPCHLPSQRLFRSAHGNTDADRKRMATSVKVAVVKVFSPTQTEIVLQQAPVRQSVNMSLVDLGMMIFHGNILENPQPVLVAHTRRTIRLVTNLHKFLDPGLYTIVRYSFADWLSTSKPPTDSVVTIHSRGVINVVQENLTESCLRNALISLIIKEGQDLKGRQGMAAYYLTKGWGGMMLVAENQMQNTYLHIECDCSESQNVVSSRGSLRTFDSIPPMSRQLIIILTQLEIYERFTVSHRLQHRNSYKKELGDWGSSRDAEHAPVLEGDLHFPIPI